MPVLMHFVSIFSNVFGDVWEEVNEAKEGCCWKCYTHGQVEMCCQENERS
jgi:hypothetical protein